MTTLWVYLKKIVTKAFVLYIKPTKSASNEHGPSEENIKINLHLSSSFFEKKFPVSVGTHLVGT